MQTGVLKAALELLDAEAPTIQTFPYTSNEAGDAEAAAWVCPVSFAQASAEKSLQQRIEAEVQLLKPWFDLGIRERGYSAANASGLEMETLIRWLCEFLLDETPAQSPQPPAPLGVAFKLAVEDLKAFYMEAITVQPGKRRMQEINDWFWDKTAAAELLWALRASLSQHPDDDLRLHAQFTLVPEVQVARRGGSEDA